MARFKKIRLGITNHFANRYKERVLKEEVDWKAKTILKHLLNEVITERHYKNLQFFKGSKSVVKMPVSKHYIIVMQKRTLITIY